MRKALLVLLSLLALSAGVNSASDELDTDLMQAVEDTNKNLASNIALKDAKASLSDARELQAMFEKVHAFFVAKGNAEDAVNLSQKSVELAGEIIRQVSASDFDGATNSATSLSRTCKTCHNFYKKS